MVENKPHPTNQFCISTFVARTLLLLGVEGICGAVAQAAHTNASNRSRGQFALGMGHDMIRAY